MDVLNAKLFSSGPIRVLRVRAQPVVSGLHSTRCRCLFAFSLEEINVLFLVLTGKGSGIRANGHKSSAVKASTTKSDFFFSSKDRLLY